MSRRLWTLTIALAFLQPSSADDVTVDVSKLIAFTTSFSFKAKDLLKDLQQSGLPPDADVPLFHSELIVQGKLIANIPGEKMKMKLDLSGHTPLMGPGSPEMPLKDTFVLTFDGPRGFVAAEDAASATDTPAGDISATACVKDKFDSSMIPPPEQVKAMIDQQAPMVSAMANQMPHAVRGDLAYYVLGPEPVPYFVLALHVADGTPAAIWGFARQFGADLPDPESAADSVQSLPPSIKFGEFVAAEDFPEVQCASSAPNTEMLEQPRSRFAFLLAEQLLKRLQLAGPLAPVTGHVFGQLPQVLRNTGKSCIVPAEASIIQTATPVQPLGLFGIAAAGMVSAAAGASIAVIAMRRAFGKTESVYLEIS
jgi:hypothetical protein